MEHDEPGQDTPGDDATEEAAGAAPDRLRRSWLRPRPDRTVPPVLVHWVDEKGSVVRLISSDGGGSSTGAPSDAS